MVEGESLLKCRFGRLIYPKSLNASARPPRGGDRRLKRWYLTPNSESVSLKMEPNRLEVLDYERLVADFEGRLVTQLRNHGAEVGYLEAWVPDEDFVKSFLNMVESASACGCGSIAIHIKQGTATPGQLDRLANEVGDLGTVSIDPQPDRTLIVVKDIKGS